MKQKTLSLMLALALCMSLNTISASAFGNMGSTAQGSVISTSNGVFAVIDDNDSLWMWGYNDLGQVGNGGVGDSTFNAPIGKYAGDGSNMRPCQTKPVKVLDDVVSVSCGNSHTAAIKKDGSLWMWGSNYHGELGNNGQSNQSFKYYEGPTYPYQDVPVKVMDGVIAVSCGANFTGAITADRTLWMWGSNDDGQLGNGKMNKGQYLGAGLISKTPIKIMENVSAINCGHNFAAAIKTDGTLWMWGNNSSSQFGNNRAGSEVDSLNVNQTTPVQVAENVISVSCGKSITAIIKKDGSAWTAGTNDVGMLGNGGRDGSNPTWQRVKGVDAYTNPSYTSISCGTAHVAALSGKDIYTWGYNTYGELGTHFKGHPFQMTNAGYPIGGVMYYNGEITKVEDLTDSIIAVCCGRDQTIAVKDDGTVWVWGANEDSNLGNGSKVNDATDSGEIIQTLPSQVPNLRAKRSGSIATPSTSYIPSVDTVTFIDVPKGQYYTEAVNWAVKKGITSGTSETTFSPNNTCTKAQIITFLWRAYGEPEPTQLNPFFPDSDRTDYHYQPLLWAMDKGMTKGIKFLEPFGVDQPCTRAQAVKYIWQAAGSPIPASKVSFSDVSAKSEYAQAVAWAVEKGITSGTGTNTFSPNTTCTRGQIVAFLYRALED